VAGANQPTYQIGLGDIGTTLRVLVAASNSVGANNAVSAASPTVVAIPPSSTSPPTISGAAQVGQTLSASTGAWSGDAVTSYTYQWQNCDTFGTNCWNIAGATGATYLIPAWELNETVQVSVTASNSGGAVRATSPLTVTIGGTTTSAPTYFPSSFWVQPLAANAALDPQSPQMVRELMNMAFGAAPFVNYNCRNATYEQWSSWNASEQTYCHQVNFRADVQINDYAPTIYTVPAGQPTVPVAMPTNVNLQAAMQAVPIPAGAIAAPGTDGQMIIWQPSSDTMWEFWRAYRDASGWHANWGGRIQHVSTDPGHYRDIPNVNSQCSSNTQVKYCEQHNWGGPAARVPNLPGLMTLAQLQSGQVNHALVIGLPDDTSSTWSWPGQSTDGLGNSIIPEGARIRIDPNLNLDAWFASLKNPDGTPRTIAPIDRIIARTMQTYGAVVVNTSNGVTFYTENWTPGGNDIFRSSGGLFGSMQPNQFMPDLPWENMQVLQTNMCNAIQPGSTLYQTPCNPPQYMTANPNPSPSYPCPPPVSASPQPGQTTGPSVTITDPTWTNVGTRVPFTAFVTDPSGVTEVDFKVDGQLRFVSNYPHCMMNRTQYGFGGAGGFWDAQSESKGWHTLEVDGYDSLGYESTASEKVYWGGP
jgi:hypothetical protein